MIAIDTNVLVRVLANDNPQQNVIARELLREHSVWIPITVLLEAESVLRSKLQLRGAEIVYAFRVLMAKPTVGVQHAEAVLKALDWTERGMDFADALHLALARDCTEFVSFDREMVRTAGQIDIAVVRQL